MSKIVGIDLGTTNSLAATVDSAIPFVIADDEGRRLTPPEVHRPERDAEPAAGTRPIACAWSNRRKRFIW